ncbi:hypothetical protein F4553_001934 [Allocatelliglobosispora scoriae]|uniref:Uncharacterized protein n=1 Tax=Allocatelliglobosispora scoriae TaxID=643052 RepID=A0A841BLN2_9ACTN|nr:hypothetical protein [Allocatelliglobosispora scoriae]MBB5868555.1 hypothetical protein [Allocatelliglobosispora scoriae]
MAWLNSDCAQVAQFQPSQWLALVELVTAKMTDVVVHPDVDWRHLSDAYYRSLSMAKESGVLSDSDSVVRSLNLTSVLLRRAGAEESVRILNPKTAIELFFQYVPLTLVEARRLADDWRGIDMQYIRVLRVVKNLLTPTLRIRLFVGDEQVLSVLSDWEAVYLKLP